MRKPIFLAVAIVVVILSAASAQQTSRKVAFLVGISTYDKAGLRNLDFAENDMASLADELKRAGFEVQVMLGSENGERRATLDNLQKILQQQFVPGLSKLNKADIALVAFSGHGMQFLVTKEDKTTGQKRRVEDSFFCPVDAHKTQPESMLSLGDLMDAISQHSGAENNLLLIDACRDNPGKGVGKGIDGSRVTQLPVNLAVLFSSSAGTRSYESPELKHGLFTYYLLEGLRGKARDFEGEVTWGTLVSYVKKQVLTNAPNVVGQPQRPNDISNLNTVPVLIRRDAATPGTYQSKFAGLRMMLIPAGEFQMGSPASEKDRGSDEGKDGPHHVRITKPFYLGEFEVTQAEFEKVMGFNPSYFSREGSGKDKVAGRDTSRFPVESFTWYDAVEFCNRLSERDGLPAYYRLSTVEKDGNHIKKAEATILGGRGYRLPSEAEWECACRAGTSTPFHFGHSNNGSEANVDGNYPYGTSTKGPYLARTTTVGSYAANRYGLYDMHGNVWEWCQDWYDGNFYSGSPTNDPVNNTAGTSRVLRGGSWYSDAWDTRSAGRYGYTPGDRYNDNGFRLARTP